MYFHQETSTTDQNIQENTHVDHVTETTTMENDNQEESNPTADQCIQENTHHAVESIAAEDANQETSPTKQSNNTTTTVVNSVTKSLLKATSPTTDESSTNTLWQEYTQTTPIGQNIDMSRTPCNLNNLPLHHQ